MVALVDVELPVIFKLPLTVDEAVEMKPPKVESPETAREESVPTEVREEFTTPVPSVVPVRTCAPPI